MPSPKTTALPTKRRRGDTASVGRLNFSALVAAIRQAHEQCAAHATRAVNVSLTQFSPCRCPSEPANIQAEGWTHIHHPVYRMWQEVRPNDARSATAAAQEPARVGLLWPYGFLDRDEVLSPTRQPVCPIKTT